MAKTESIEEVIIDTKNEPMASKSVQKLVRGMRAKLDKCKKVSIKIPIDKQNPKDLDVTVQINGYVFQMKRGEEITVPEPVKVLLERGNYI